ncbi:MAG: TIGR01777 family oxidoreductase [Rikenellaceae bacterium]|nr:TIGR01777 family oxidoreductase [Rikenellaceae bacterium]
MKIAISGATGFVGSHLSAFLRERGDEVLSLPRELFTEGEQATLAGVLSQCDAVINLAGATLNKRWTEAYRQEMYDSRIGTTRAIVEAINSLKNKPALFISASAVGYYPSAGCYGESDARKGDGFLADLCRDWEDEAAKVSPEVRCVITRFGVVLSPDGGVFPKVAYPAQHRIAVQFGSGMQNFAWIDLRDLLRAMEFVITHPDIRGPVNMVSPRRINNGQFMRAVANRFRSWMVLPLPGVLLHMIWGDASQLLLSGQCAYPEKLLTHGFRFESHGINDFLSRI